MIIWPVRPAAARRPLEVIVPRGTTDAEVDELLEETALGREEGGDGA
jgi:hypothetical protein